MRFMVDLTDTLGKHPIPIPKEADHARMQEGGPEATPDKIRPKPCMCALGLP
jgi:hypothetical protein